MVGKERKGLGFGGLMVLGMFLINLALPGWAQEHKGGQTGKQQQVRSTQKVGKQQEVKKIKKTQKTKKTARQKPVKKN